MIINFGSLKSLQGIILILIIAIIIVTVFSAYINSQESANDKKRITDITKIQEALKVAFDVNGFYPGTMNDKAKGIETFLDFWPSAPKPHANCNAADNKYTYSDRSNGSDYSLTFCLEKKYQSLSAGRHTANSGGIQ